MITEEKFITSLKNAYQNIEYCNFLDKRKVKNMDSECECDKKVTLATYKNYFLYVYENDAFQNKYFFL